MKLKSKMRKNTACAKKITFHACARESKHPERKEGPGVQNYKMCTVGPFSTSSSRSRGIVKRLLLPPRRMVLELDLKSPLLGWNVTLVENVGTSNIFWHDLSILFVTGKRSKKPFGVLHKRYHSERFIHLWLYFSLSFCSYKVGERNKSRRARLFGVQ